MKKKTEQKILTMIIVLALITLAVLVSSIVYEEEMRKNKQAVESTATPIIKNKDINVEETQEKEDVPQEQEAAKEEYVGEEEKEAEQENVASQAQSKDEKAVELAKKEWGEDNSVTFNIEEKDGNKYYVAVKKDATAIKWYEVDTDKWTISEY